MESSEALNRPALAARQVPFRGRLADAAYRQLRESIESGELPPGTVIFGPKVVTDLRMSRTPVREALQRLVTEGLLRQLHRGYQVVEATHRDIINAYAVRGMLEGMAARQAASFGRRVDVVRLEEVLEREREALSSETSSEELSRTIEEFHVVLAEISANDLLQSALDVARTRTEPYRRRRSVIPGVAAGDIEQHRQIIDAIQSGNPLIAELTVRMLTRRTIRDLTGSGLVDDDEMSELLDYLRSKRGEGRPPTDTPS
jgi:DNA-binding GntR family transcriptional regulator